MKKNSVTLLLVLAIISLFFIFHSNQVFSGHAAVSVQNTTKCDDSLWKHVYAGDARKFSKPQDRLKVIKDCVTITGTIIKGKPEADGDFHVTVLLDSQYTSMLNAKNISEQHGYLVIEPVCENTVSQRDTLQEGSCTGFAQKVYNHSFDGKHVSITGAYVTDQEHGWNEIHPVSDISLN